MAQIFILNLVIKIFFKAYSYTKGEYNLNDCITERVITEGEFIAQKGATVRQTAKVFGVSKSTVHSDVTWRLKTIDKELYEKVKQILFINLSERHVRGGMATREKFKGK